MYKNAFLFLFLMFLLKTNLSAQADTSWIKTYGGTLNDKGHVVQPTDDGGYIMTGWTESLGAGGADIYLVKTNANGDTTWTKTYGGTGNDYGYCVQITDDEGYVIVGSTTSFGAGGADIYIIKTYANGDTIWTNTYGDGNNNGASWVQQTDDGGYIICGTTNEIGYDNIYIIKTNSDGDTSWTRTWELSILDDRSAYVQQTFDGGYFITGHSYMSGVFVNLIKTDDQGYEEWTKLYQRALDDRALSAQQTADSGYVITGWTQTGPTLNGRDIWLLKTDKNGDTTWTQTYGGTGMDIGYSVIQTKTHDGYFITGTTTSIGAGGSDIWLLRTDINGDTVWTKTIGGLNNDEGLCIRETKDNALILAGYTESIGAGGQDAELIKVNLQPEIQSISPTKNELNVPVSTNISATFTDNIMTSSINDTTFLVFSKFTGQSAGTISYDSPTHTATFNPANDFHVGEVIMVVLTKDIQFENGLYLNKSFTWSFTCAVDNGSAFFVLDSSYATGYATSTSVVADFNQDGNLDVAVTSHSSNQVSVYFNDGNAVFNLSSNYGMAASPLQSLYAADFDNDGDIDLVAARRHSTGIIYLLLNVGDGTFSIQPSILTYSSEPGSLTAADVDGDDDLDIITGNAGSDNLSVLLNNGDATFSFDTNYSVGDVAGIYAADMDNDGDQDIVGGLWANWDLFVMMNNSNGQFQPAEIYDTGETPGFVIAADLNGDGYLDLSNTNHYENTVHVYLNNEDGTFPSFSSYDIGSGAYVALPADLDGDGDLDLAVQNYADDNLSILVNNGSGIFADQELIEAADAPMYLAYGDFDNDGDLDLVAPNLNSNSFSIFLNTEPSDIEIANNVFPINFSLSQNYPNPFNPSTTIKYSVGAIHESPVQNVNLSIYNILGQKLATLVNKKQPAGIYEVEWDASDFSSGVYLYRFEAESGFVQIKKLVLLK